MLGREPLEPLLVALEPHVVVLFHTRAHGRSRASFSLGGLFAEQNAALRRWVRVIGAVRGRARQVLRKSEVIASIGVEADAGHPTEVVIRPREVAALARLGVGIELVVYREP